jgi:hypothetical protein
MSEYSGKAGTIYVNVSRNNTPVNRCFEVWYEDFCELGSGATEVEALHNAFANTADILILISEATIKASETPQPLNTLGK